MNSDEMQAMETGIAVAHTNSPEEATAKLREEREVKRWSERIQQARKFDEPAREQYVKDRRYARGDSGFEVDANIVGTNIDILESFLYAKDPDFDVTPGPVVRPPSIDSLRDAVEDQVQDDPAILMAGRVAASAAVAAGLSEDDALKIGQAAEDMKVEELIRTEVKKLHREFQRRRREVKNFAETCEIIGSRMWTDASLKRRGRPFVRSALTIGVGILKASWQERTEPSPETVTAINDLQSNIRRHQLAKKKAEEGGFFDRVTGMFRAWMVDDDKVISDLEDQVRALQAQPEPVVERGFVIDNVAGEDFQVAPGFTINNHVDAPWNAHRIFMHCDDAEAAFDLTSEDLAKAVKYRPRRPQMLRHESVMVEKSRVSAKEADAFVNGNSSDGDDDVDSNSDASETKANFLCLWEIWDRDANAVKTMIEGVCRWVKPAWIPTATTRFYPFFLFCTSEVDGQRHPQSLPTRSAKLVDEYYRIGSAEAEHRRRVLPKTAFNAGALDPKEVAKLEKGGIQEMVALKLVDPTGKVGDILQPVAYAAIDPRLYDRGPIIQEINRVWGTQEALGGAVNVDKTATEADIANQGFQARSGSRRDLLEICLGELALYTVEVSRAHVTNADAVAMAGPDAFWPPYEGPTDMVKMLSINIRAGSSGKPNTKAERESWATLLPMLEASIAEIGQLRGASPAAIADAKEQLLRITAERSGERIDIDQLIPQADEGMPGMPVAAVPGGPAGPNPPAVSGASAAAAAPPAADSAAA